MLAHGMVHTYELSIPIFVSIWLTEFDVVNLGLTQVEVTAATLGIVVTAGYGLFGVGALPGGVLVDRIGSRRLISLCLFGMAGSFVLLGLSPNLVVVTLALLCWGAAASVYHPAGLALISKGVDERGTGFAYHGIAGNVGIGLGPLLTAVLLMFLDWTTVAMLLALPALAAGAYALRARFDESAAVDAGAGGSSKADAGVDSLGEFLAESKRMVAGGFVVVFLVVMCSGLYYRGVLTFLPDLLSGLGTFEPVPLASLLPAGLASALGVTADSGQTLQPERYFYSGLLMVGVLGQYAGGKLTDRLPVEWGLVGSFGALAVLAVLFLPVVSAGLVPLLAFGAVLGFFLFVIQPFYQATVAEYTPAGTRGLSYGYTYLGVFGVGALGGALAGAILTYATPTALFVTLAGIAVAGASFGVYLARRGGNSAGAEVASD
ncbi:MFS transporter [Halogeometricum sp. S1BR25-6]|uniref:MFS transporter n=1 Tax=Halogeometricum salsisoli TaxID=2950536 RepID=A0ABU2GFP2_9EURY|nr:MFS transporter [Halogeometricum sp. S1BR25-6]MDS0299113.1 MFS transporter [Halogeometricum sp. S1BR25-6]